MQKEQRVFYFDNRKMQDTYLDNELNQEEVYLATKKFRKNRLGGYCKGIKEWRAKKIFMRTHFFMKTKTMTTS